MKPYHGRIESLRHTGCDREHPHQPRLDVRIFCFAAVDSCAARRLYRPERQLPSLAAGPVHTTQRWQFPSLQAKSPCFSHAHYTTWVLEQLEAGTME